MDPKIYRYIIYYVYISIYLYYIDMIYRYTLNIKLKTMRLINSKIRIKSSNLIDILKFLKLVCNTVPKVRFELIETNNTFQLKFNLVKSRLTKPELFWLKCFIKKFIENHEH